MNTIEVIVIAVILLLIFLISINTCSCINTILLNVNNNTVRFLMILIIIAIGKYDIKIAGLIGLLFLIMINKANHIEGLENIEDNQYSNLNIWLITMIINPMKYIFALTPNEFNIVDEINEINVSDDCKTFKEKYREIVDSKLVDNIVVLGISTQNADNNKELHEIALLFKSLKYDEMISDFTKLLEDKNTLEKYKKDPFLTNLMEKKNITLDLTNIKNKLLPFLKQNKECAIKFFSKVVSQKFTKESQEAIMKNLENNYKKNSKNKKITKDKLMEKSIKDDSILKCTELQKEDDDCKNGSFCSNGNYCVTKKKGVGSKYLCSPFENPVKCNDARFSCPSDFTCIPEQKCKDNINGMISNQFMNTDGYRKYKEIPNKKQQIKKPETILNDESIQKPRSSPLKSRKSIEKPKSSPLKYKESEQKPQKISNDMTKKLDDMLLKKNNTNKFKRNIHIQKGPEYEREQDDIDETDVLIAKDFPKIKYSNKSYSNTSYNYDHNPSYTEPIVDCKINKHDFYKSKNMCPDCK
jgi:hypothetical protein